MKFKKIADVLGFALPCFLWWLQMMNLPADTDWGVFDQLYDWIWLNKNDIGVLASLFVVTCLFLANNSNPCKKWLKEYLNDSIRTIFAGDYEKTRVTIFRTRRGYRFIHKYIWHAFVKCLFSHCRDGLFWVHVKAFPNPFKKYICMYVRCSNPHQEGSSTYFKIANKEKEISGIASYAEYSRKARKIETEYISSFYSLKQEYTPTQAKKIVKYRKANKLTDEKMSCLHRLSNHLYAEPIFSSKNEIWGVLVIDIDSPEKDVFQGKEEAVVGVVKAISLSINHI